MALTAYQSFFKPQELDALTAVYDAAWKHLCATHNRITSGQEVDIKERLAKMILASACTGERDSESREGRLTTKANLRLYEFRSPIRGDGSPERYF
jgi:hypothetical protein